MKVMNLMKVVMLLAILTLFSAPSWAGSFSLYGSYWDTKDADASWGAGVRTGFNFTKMLELEFRGTYYPDFKNDQFSGQAFELTAIVISGAAGLALGHALLAPGRHTRLQALKRAASDAVLLLYLVIAMLVIAAALEAFWSSSRWIEPWVKYSVGGACWVLVLGYLGWQGRPRHAAPTAGGSMHAG